MNSMKRVFYWILLASKVNRRRELSAPIFLLNADCFDKMFEWLSLEDLQSLSETSKRIQQEVGRYFQKNYAGVNVYCNRNKDGLTAFVNVSMNGFSEYIEKLTVSDGDFDNFIYIAGNCTSLKELNFTHTTLTTRKIKCIKKILEKIEVLNINGGKVNGELYSMLLKYCPNLQRLFIQNIKIKSRFDCVNEWLLKEYPKLEHFELLSYKNLRMSEIKTFFTMNKNIRSFSTNCHLIDLFWTGLKEMDVNLDELTVLIDHNERKMINSICTVLNTLHESGFYRRLHLKGNEICFFRNQYFFHLGSLKALEILNCEHLFAPVTSNDLSPLIGVKDVEIFSSECCVDTMALAKDLIQLERVTFTYATLDHILPLIYFASKLKEITLKKGIRAGTHVIPLPMLNKRRASLANACKITLYVNCKMYSETKTNIGKTNFKFIELTRM